MTTTIVEMPKLTSSRPARNTFKVQRKQWAKWSAKARAVFNALYAHMGDQALYLHPKAKPMPAPQWKTTRWNAAWIAADAVDGRA